MQMADQGFVLRQDNNLKHTSKLCQRYIKSKEEQHIFQLMSWLLQDELDRKVRAKQLTSVAHLWQLLQEKMGQKYLQSTSSH